MSAEPDDWGWLSAAAVQPPSGQLVLIWFATGDVRVGQWNGTAMCWAPPRADRLFRIQPTHWQPLPDGPGGAKPKTEGLRANE